MSTQLNTLIMFDEALMDLDMAQSWIDAARVAHATDQEVQLHLDRRQTFVNAKRMRIAKAMLEIASQN